MTHWRDDAAGAMMANAAPDDTPDDVDWSDSLREATRPDPEQQAAADEDALAFDVGSDLMSSEDPFAGTPEEVADGDDEGGTPPVDIETLARRPKIHVRERSDEPVYKRLARRAAHHVRQVRPRRVVGAAFFVFALALFGVAILFRTPIVARVPDLAGLYALAGFEVNLRGLEFKDLRTFRELDDGSIVLVIEGTIQNVSDEPAYVPPSALPCAARTPRRSTPGWSNPAPAASRHPTPHAFARALHPLRIWPPTSMCASSSGRTRSRQA